VTAKLMERWQLAQTQASAQCQGKVQADKGSRSASWDASAKCGERKHDNRFFWNPEA
jgi:hypothetical protein